MAREAYSLCAASMISRLRSRSRRMKARSSLALAATSMPLAISCNRTSCGGVARSAPTGSAAFQLAPHFQHQKLLLRISAVQRGCPCAAGPAPDLRAQGAAALRGWACGRCPVVQTSAYSDRNSPGASFSVTIISSSRQIGLLGQRLALALARPGSGCAASRVCRAHYGAILACAQICRRFRTILANFSYSSSLTV